MRKLAIGEVQDMQLQLMKKLHRFLEDEEIPYYLLAGSALGAVRHEGFIPWDDDIDIGMLREDYERFLKVANRFNTENEILNYRNSENCDFVLTRIYFPRTKIDIASIEKTKLDKRLYMDIFPLDNVPDDARELQEFEKKILSKRVQIQRIDARNYGDSNIKYFFKRVVSNCLRPLRQRILEKDEALMRTYEKIETRCVCSLCSQYSFRKQVMPREFYGSPTLHKFEDTEFYCPENLDKYLTTLYGADYMQVPPLDKRRKGHNIYILD